MFMASNGFSENKVTPRARVSFCVLFSRDFSRLPQKESWLPGYSCSLASQVDVFRSFVTRSSPKESKALRMSA